MTDESRLINGGITYPRGFVANGVLCHIKASRTSEDVALVVSDKICNAAGLFTPNKVKAECVKWDIERLKRGKVRAIVANSGNANACTGKVGAEDAKRMAEVAARAIGDTAENVLVCSTGVIGQRLPVEKIEGAMDALFAGLNNGEGAHKAARAIMTTDTRMKECAIEGKIGGAVVRIGAMCKGSGMIHLNLGTMLCFIATDVAITSDMLHSSLSYVAERTFNCVSIDGDTSTNDTLLILANGEAGNHEIADIGEDYEKFTAMLMTLCKDMAKKIASDGEGATRLIECNVTGAKDDKSARGLAKSVISSNLVKAAMFGRDANCGRVLCALGYSGYDFDSNKTAVAFASGGDSVVVIRDGVGLAFDEEKARKVLSAGEVQINVSLEDGDGAGTAWGCDLTYDYVKINGDYRT